MILVTGGLGFIGLHTAYALIQKGERVVLGRHHTLRVPAFLTDEIDRRVWIEPLDVGNPHEVYSVVERHGVDRVVHLVFPGWGVSSLSAEFQTNMQGLWNVLEAARRFRMRRVVLASSIDVYAGLFHGPFREDQDLPVHGGGPIGSYKKAWEIMGFYYGSQTAVDVVAARIGVTYGPLYRSMKNLPSQICHALARGQPLKIAAKSDVPSLERSANDFCYVTDCAHGLQQLAMAPELAHRVYNLGGGRAISTSELLEAGKRLGLQLTTSIEGETTESEGAEALYMDLSRIRDDVGYQPGYDLHHGLAAYVEWLATHAE